MRLNKMTVGMFAMASMLFATSCSQDEMQEMGAGGKYVTATFNVAAPEGINTRAIGDGTTVNKVVCATYDANGAEMTDLRQYLPIQNKQAQYSIRLAKGQNYRVAFFAYYDADGDNMPEHYNITDLKNIEILGNQLSNVEERDAFTAYYDIETGATMQPIEKDITLYRPFAQLNMGSYQDDWTAAVAAGVTVNQTQVTVSNVYNAFSAYNDEVVGETSEVTFALNVLPANGQEWLYADVDQNGQPESYKYLALNYLLVGDKNNEKNLTDIKFTWSTADGKTNEPVTEFKNIPVQRNYRTNILGWLLTNPAVFNITIDERFEELDSPYEDDYNIVAIDGTVSAEEMAKSGYTDYIDEGATEVDVIENMHITSDGTAIVVNDVKAASGTLCIFNSIIDAKTFIELNDYVTIIVKDCHLNVEQLIKINTQYTAHQFIFDNCYFNGQPMRSADKSKYFTSDFLSLNTVFIYFTKDSEDSDDNTGNEGEGGNTGGEGEGGNTGGEGATEDVKMSADKDNYGAIEEGMFCITGKTFNGTVTLDESVAGTSGQYYFENVTFNNTINVTEDVTVFLVNCNFSKKGLINVTSANGWVYYRNCTVDGILVNGSNKAELLGTSKCSGI